MTDSAAAPVQADAPGRPSLYQAAMGEDFARLHPALRRFHGLQGRVTLHGQVTTEPPQGRWARWLGGRLGTPLEARQGPLRFVLDARPDEEHWQRHFPGQSMASRLRRDGHRIVERLGPARLVFVLEADQGRLRMRLQSLRFAGLPCPRWLRPAVVADEHGETGADGRPDRLHFDVRAAVPLVGQVARYRGWLDMPATVAAEGQQSKEGTSP